MAYHINFKGEVGKCAADIACPFGDFETQHYTTAEQARRAYELSMEGKSVKQALSKKAYFEQRSEEEKRGYEEWSLKTEAEAEERREQEKAEKKKTEEREKWLKKMRPPKTVLPTLGEPGYHTRVGDELVWVPDAYSPEILEAHEAAVRERSAEDFYHNHMKFPPRWVMRVADLTPPERNLYLRLRIFEKKAKEFEKSGIAYPYTRAVEMAAAEAYGDGEDEETREWLSRWVEREPGKDPQRVFRWVLTGQDLIEGMEYEDRPSWPAEEQRVGQRSMAEVDAKELLSGVFLEGRVPMVDHDPRKVLREREERGLLQS